MDETDELKDALNRIYAACLTVDLGGLTAREAIDKIASDPTLTRVVDERLGAAHDG